MADDFRFPATNTLRFDNFTTNNLLNDEHVLGHNIPPSYPTAGIPGIPDIPDIPNIPEILPPLINPKQQQQQQQQQSSFPSSQQQQPRRAAGVAHSNMNAFNLETNTSASDAGMMHQQQHLDNSHANNSPRGFHHPGLHHGNTVSSSHHNVPLHNNNSSVVGSVASHCLVIGGQRVPITGAPPQHNPATAAAMMNMKTNTNMSFSSNSPQHAQQYTQQQQHAGHMSPLSNPHSPTQHIQQQQHNTPHTAAAVVASALMPQATASNVSIDANKLKQMLAVKAPGGRLDQVSMNKMKGQIIKTSDERLMFVTKVEGHHRGYLIQQQNNAQGQPLHNNIGSPNNNNNVVSSPTALLSPGSIPSPTNLTNSSQFTRLQQQPASQIISASDHNNGTKAAGVGGVDDSRAGGAINFTLGTETGNTSKPTEPLLKTDMKSLREKLLNLRNPLKTALNLNNKTTSITFPPPQINTPLARTTTGDPYDSHANRSEGANSNQAMDHDGGDEEEEGQEIEFSENDLTAEMEEEEDDEEGVVEDPNNSNMAEEEDDDDEEEDDEDEDEEEEVEGSQKVRNASTDEEDSVPLSKLGGNVVAGGGVDAGGKKGKGKKGRPKGKVGGRGKGKKKDARKPKK